MVKDIRWDAELGSQNMELRLVEYFADEFNKQVGNWVKSNITCQKFEELYEIKHSGLKMDEIYAVEFIGGATIVPKLQACDNHLDQIKDWDINNLPRNQ
ncbi:hypothetical protein CUMW_268750 [Citrus unshiu]|uniref:Uncharacterized protein n=1 Tax=Citrus unshiu TaxID=55188 RepID=A0A2H5QWP7_CITUN|nr:hypothetical protein CUMW_268750 [Citrus unshiu]